MGPTSALYKGGNGGSEGFEKVGPLVQVLGFGGGGGQRVPLVGDVKSSPTARGRMLRLERKKQEEREVAGGRAWRVARWGQHRRIAGGRAGEEEGRAGGWGAAGRGVGGTLGVAVVRLPLTGCTSDPRGQALGFGGGGQRRGGNWEQKAPSERRPTCQEGDSNPGHVRRQCTELQLGHTARDQYGGPGISMGGQGYRVGAGEGRGWSARAAVGPPITLYKG